MASPCRGRPPRCLLGAALLLTLDCAQALLSRFDLTFIIVDDPDEDRDKLLSEHVLAQHGSVPAHGQGLTGHSGAAERTSDLLQRLQFGEKGYSDPLPAELFRKYIAYARAFAQPTLSADARVVLQDFYLVLREDHMTEESTPITTRQLESLIRLTQARAKLELREVASKEHAEDVVEMMRQSMVDVNLDEGGNMGADGRHILM